MILQKYDEVETFQFVLILYWVSLYKVDLYSHIARMHNGNKRSNKLNYVLDLDNMQKYFPYKATFLS